MAISWNNWGFKPAPTWDGGEGEGQGDGFPLSRERRLGSRPWVPASAGTTIGEPAPTQVRRGRGGTPPGRPSGYRHRIGVRGRLFAGMTDGSRERGKEGPPSQSSPQMGEEARRGWGNRSGGDGFPFPRERRLGGCPSGYRPRIGVRGRLFAGMTDGGRSRPVDALG